LDHPLDGKIFLLRDTRNLITNIKIEADSNFLSLFKEEENLICSNKDISQAIPFYLHKIKDSPNTYKLFSCKTSKWMSKENVKGSDVWIQFATGKNELSKAASIYFLKQKNGDYKLWSEDVSRFIFSMTGDDQCRLNL
jgi:hypothetical protein